MKSLWIAYLFWLIGGLFGWHLAYLGFSTSAIGYTISFGGFGLSWLSDFYHLSTYVHASNESFYFVENQKVLERFQLFPRISWTTCVFQCIMGQYTSHIFSCLLPSEVELPFYEILASLGAGLGVYIAGKMGTSSSATSSLFWTCVVGSISQIIMEICFIFMAAYQEHDDDDGYDNDAHGYALFFHVAAFYWTTIWKKTADPIDDQDKEGEVVPIVKKSKSACKGLSLHALGMIVWTVLCFVALRQHGSVTMMNSNSGVLETYTVREIMDNIQASPFWTSFSTAKLFQDFQDSESFWESLKEYADVDGVGQSYATLGVPDSATDVQVKNAYRKLILEFHPDKLTVEQTLDSKKVLQAKETFVRIQKAYENVMSTRNVGKNKFPVRDEL